MKHTAIVKLNAMRRVEKKAKHNSYEFPYVG